ncbi:MAG: hypothetical protein IKR85_06645 [Clostridia bacterium]|nr:hypothetical protein [Clostridia bacterium]
MFRTDPVKKRNRTSDMLEDLLPRIFDAQSAEDVREINDMLMRKESTSRFCAKALDAFSELVKELYKSEEIPEDALEEFISRARRLLDTEQPDKRKTRFVIALSAKKPVKNEEKEAILQLERQASVLAEEINTLSLRRDEYARSAAALPQTSPEFQRARMEYNSLSKQIKLKNDIFNKCMGDLDALRMKVSVEESIQLERHMRMIAGGALKDPDEYLAELDSARVLRGKAERQLDAFRQGSREFLDEADTAQSVVQDDDFAGEVARLTRVESAREQADMPLPTAAPEADAAESVAERVRRAADAALSAYERAQTQEAPALSVSMPQTLNARAELERQLIDELGVLSAQREEPDAPAQEQPAYKPEEPAAPQSEQSYTGMLNPLDQF